MSSPPSPSRPTMSLEAFYFLLEEEGQALLAELAQGPITQDNHLALASDLRRRVSAEQAHALLETALLRRRAAAKFSRAGEMYFTRAALEQASAEIISQYRAERFAAAGFNRLADLGCGIGGDALGLAAGAQVTGVDWNLLRLAMAQENLRAYGLGSHFHSLQADLQTLSPLPVEALFADPGRRDEFGRRIFSVHQYRPPLALIESWREKVAHMGVKISPGVNYEELPQTAEVEFISVAGEVREGVLWYGSLRTDVQRRATLLPQRATLTDGDGPQEADVTGPGAYLYEPDGAVIRAHLVGQLAHCLGAAQMDATIAYLTAGEQQPTPFARCYRLEDAFPFQLKRLRHYLRGRNIGRVTIKKRGSPLDPDMLRRRLRLKGEEACVIFLTQVQGEPTVLVGQEVESDS